MKGHILDGAAPVLADGGSVATALGDLDDGREVRDGDRTVTFVDDVPFGHRFAPDPLPAGGTVRRYGEVIGRITAAVAVAPSVP